MRRFLIAALLAAGPALADEMVYRDGNVSVHLQNKPCESQLVKQLSGSIAALAEAQMGAGYVVFRGKQTALCWAIKDDSILVIDEDGDGGAIPIAAFKMDSGV